MKQFDLEQSIFNCWHITDDLDVLLENVLENDNLTKDDIANILLGMRDLYQLKFEKCFEDFEDFLAEKHGKQMPIEF